MVDRIEIKPVERPIDAVVQIPGSKSITNRALLLAALADGASRIEGALFSDDTRYMSEALNALGIQVLGDEANATYSVVGAGGKIPSHRADLYLGNAGTATRFLTAALALGEGEYRIDGVERMRQRPIEDLLGALRQLGVDAESESGTGCPPVIIRSNGLPGGTARLRGDASSQYLSALLMVAPLSQNGIEIDIIGKLASKPYIGITLQMMMQWSEILSYSETGGYKPDEDGVSLCYSVAPGQAYQPRTYRVEPDASTASYFFAAAAVTGGRVRVEGLGKRALQGDLAFVDVLAQMGCDVEQTEDYTEVRGPEHLRGVDVDMNAISDTVMTLAAIAPFADGPTTIRNVANIRLKETDRLHAVATELNRLGVEAKEWDDGIEIYPAKYLKPADIKTYDDHRMAMSFAVTGLKAPGVTILDPGCTAKTVPDFFTRFQSLYCNHGG